VSEQEADRNETASSAPSGVRPTAAEAFLLESQAFALALAGMNAVASQQLAVLASQITTVAALRRFLDE